MYINRKYINESITFIINKNERNTVPLRSALYLVSSILIKVFIRNRCEGTASGSPVVSLKILENLKESIYLPALNSNFVVL